MTSYRYLGYGVTDSNGVAHLKYDKDGHEISPQGYHGTGAGEVDVIASVDKPITSSSIVSEPYTVDDTYWYDGTTSSSDITDYYNFSSTNANTVTVDSTGILIETDVSQYSTSYNIITPKRGGTFVDVPFTAYFEIVERSKYVIILHTKTSDNRENWPYVSTVGKYKIVVNSSTIKIYRNGNLISTISNNYAQCRIYLQHKRTDGNGYIKIKDFKMYLHEE